MEQAGDFLEESRALYGLLVNRPEADFSKVTQFKDWNVDDVLRHLHFWNWMAELQIADEARLEIELISVGKEGMRPRERSLVVLGVNTFGLTYIVRKEDPPGPMPFLKLSAPSGATWTFGEEDGANRIEGRATEFCQVVTQTRNIKDTELKVTGAVATDWMSKAQCFAGGRNDPPPPGTRFRASVTV